MDHKKFLALYRSMKKIGDLASQLKHVKRENFVDPNTVWIAGIDGTYDIKIGEGSIIAPNVYLFGKIVIGRDTGIGPNIQLYNVHIGDRCKIGRPQLIDANIGDDVTIGCFTEIVRTRIGNRSNDVHASYCGDTVIGEDCNIGYGTVTANFDGSPIKNKTLIGDRVNTGVGCNLVSKKDKLRPNEPGMLFIGDDAVIGAGAIVLADVPPNTTIIGVWKGDSTIIKDENNEQGRK